MFDFVYLLPYLAQINVSDINGGCGRPQSQNVKRQDKCR